MDGADAQPSCPVTTQDVGDFMSSADVKDARFRRYPNPVGLGPRGWRRLAISGR
jgi:hypothetical protein